MTLDKLGGASKCPNTSQLVQTDKLEKMTVVWKTKQPRLLQLFKHPTAGEIVGTLILKHAMPS